MAQPNDRCSPRDEAIMSLTAGVIAGLVGAGVLGGAGLWVLALGRRREELDKSHRVVVPIFGVVGVPTVLAVGVALLLCAYHAAAFSLTAMGTNALPTPLTVDRWWVLPLGFGIVVVLCWVIERLEQSFDPPSTTPPTEQ